MTDETNPQPDDTANVLLEGLEVPEEVKAEDAEQEPAPEPEAKAEEPEADPEPEPEPDPEPEEDKSAHGLMKALLDERDKRQAAERERDQLKGQQNPEHNEPDPIDPMDDDFDKKLRTMVQKGSAQAYENALVAMSAAQLKRDGIEFDAGTWKEALSQDPSLYGKAIQSGDPMRWAHDHLEERKLLASSGGISGLREQIEREIREKLVKEGVVSAKADQAAKSQAVKDAIANQPKSTANLASKDPTPEQAELPGAMEDFLKD